ncbi:rhamnulokinase [Alicyclobacillus herbarius]|uniref:rhamnulokinase n=1 Tax=Alicyclobacillus herbarius TaxID=122960 RepID=UPI000413D336|nr:rhamnulokinase family protein [Alicyclobacillus herbarius]
MRARWRGFAADLGASNGRTVLGEFDGKVLSLRELTRFANHPVTLGDTVYWDFPRLFHEVWQGLLKTRLTGGVRTLGIDTWAVDFGLLDKHGELLANPRHYRNPHFAQAMTRVLAHTSRQELFQRTGIQILPINTIFQLAYLAIERPQLLAASQHAVLLPDLFTYYLTGELASEFTNATTTQLLRQGTAMWDAELLKAVGLPSGLFPPVVHPLHRLGQLRSELREQLGTDTIEVVNVAEHDTASAILALPCESENVAYISSGTWSLVGTLVGRPLITEQTERFNFTNEGGVGNYRLLKNVMGLWLLQEVRRIWQTEGREVSFAEMAALAETAPPMTCVINPDADVFLAPDHMVRAIRAYAVQSGQQPPATEAALLRCILESLALKYRYVLEHLEQVTGRRFDAIHVVGGGVHNATLCQWTADATGKTVIAGPAEATVVGNLCAQLVADEELSGLNEVPALIQRSFQQTIYTPSAEDGRWDSGYERLLALVNEENAMPTSTPLGQAGRTNR